MSICGAQALQAQSALQGKAMETTEYIKLSVALTSICHIFIICHINIQTLNFMRCLLQITGASCLCATCHIVSATSYTLLTYINHIAHNNKLY